MSKRAPNKQQPLQALLTPQLATGGIFETLTSYVSSYYDPKLPEPTITGVNKRYKYIKLSNNSPKMVVEKSIQDHYVRVGYTIFYWIIYFLGLQKWLYGDSCPNMFEVLEGIEDSYVDDRMDNPKLTRPERIISDLCYLSFLHQIGIKDGFDSEGVVGGNSRTPDINRLHRPFVRVYGPMIRDVIQDIACRKCSIFDVRLAGLTLSMIYKFVASLYAVIFLFQSGFSLLSGLLAPVLGLIVFATQNAFVTTLVICLGAFRYSSRLEVYYYCFTYNVEIINLILTKWDIGKVISKTSYEEEAGEERTMLENVVADVFLPVSVFDEVTNDFEGDKNDEYYTKSKPVLRFLPNVYVLPYLIEHMRLFTQNGRSGTEAVLRKVGSVFLQENTNVNMLDYEFLLTQALISMSSTSTFLDLRDTEEMTKVL